MPQATPAIQDYLKALLELSDSGQPVHSSELARTLGYTKASVSRAMTVLREKGFIEKERYGTITLTHPGRQTALAVRRRNRLLTAFLTDVLGVPPEQARLDACRMEHALSSESADRLERYLTGQSQAN